MKYVFYKNASTPPYLIFFCTSRCVCNCKHCFNWKRKERRKKELSLGEIKKISANIDSFYFLLLTGGEPFLRDDLSEIIKVFYNNNKIRTLATPTSGFNSNKIYQTCCKILDECKDLKYTLNISIDGVGELHDKIRGHKGLFKEAVKTFNLAKRLKDKYKNFDVGVITTVSKYNQEHLEEVYEYIKDSLKTDIWSVFLTRGLPRDPAAKVVDIDKYKKIYEQINNEKRLKGYTNFLLSGFNNAKNKMRYKLIIDYAKGDAKTECYAGLLNGVIYEDGKVYACELKDYLLGDLRRNNYDFKDIWNSQKAKEIRKKIEKYSCGCTHECFLTTNILFNIKLYPCLIKEWLKSKTN